MIKEAQVATTFSLQGKRIIIAKPGLDGHDAGAKIIALTLRDAGADVIYTGLRKTPEFIARMAVDEDADMLGLSILSGSHCELVAATIAALRDLGGEDIKVFVGGTIPAHDHETLRTAGVIDIYTAEMRLDSVVGSIVGHLGSS
jgi:methylmalonyl-CoA mutase C-terminal domain/subunit